MHTPRALRALHDRFANEPAIRNIAGRLEELCGKKEGRQDAEALIGLYQKSLALIEKAMWSVGPDPETLDNFHQAFCELEGLIQRRGVDRRHRFFIIIPVADRPQHLQNILDSLLAQCRMFGYGGFDGRFKKVAVVVADDSEDVSVVRRNREIVQAFARKGLGGIYFGGDEQLEILNSLSTEEQAQLVRILGDPRRTGMQHKGASVTRNLAYLFSSGLDGLDNALFLFVDSDEQFKVRITHQERTEDIPALNYFYSLDRLFTERNVQVATGKVVGDPPVSPAVMAGNFLVDIIAFLQRMTTVEPDRPCGCHGDVNTGGDAAYHDMAGLFGFEQGQDAYAYRCDLEGVHDFGACFEAFAEKLDRFFEGEHLTRPTHYSYSDAVATASPARTVYTGNYVLRAEALKYFIPFADLKLRMAGPTLGRLIQAELGEKFVAVNLPLLHTRTVDEQFEFRSGVDRRQGRVDLSGEFERQFFGDVMLFAVRELIALGYPGTPLSQRQISDVVEAVEERMQRFYAEKRRAIQKGLSEARTRFNAPELWWRNRRDMIIARERFERFFDNIELNFGAGSRGHALIGPGDHRNRRLEAIKNAIACYRADRAAWKSLLRRLGHAPEQYIEELAT